MSYRILYVEDEKILGNLVAEILEKAGYEVMLIANGDTAHQAFRKFKPHLCLLDIMLPGKDGFEIARQIKQTDLNVPILFLTAKIQPADVVAGFNAGCNDYIRKPFNSDELLVRIQHWLNEKHGRSEMYTTSDCRIGNIHFYPQRNMLETQDGIINLTHKESLLLYLLYTHRNNILAREHILQKVWENDSVYNSRTLDVYINRLRKYLSGTASQIITLKGIGYRFICE